MEPTVHDLLTFHRPDRAAYERLVALGVAREPARDAVALLMWLHRRGCAGDDATTRVPAMVFTPAQAARLVAEAGALLAGAPTPVEATASLCGVDARRVRGLLARTPADDVRRGVAAVVGGIGSLVFDDGLHELMWHYQAAGGGALPPALAAPYRGFNAPAPGAPQPEEVQEQEEEERIRDQEEEEEVQDHQEEEDDGCSLFVTFSKGEDQPPWTHEEAEVCIAEMWGDLVERVMMEKTPGEPPSYGRVVLCSAEEVEAILGGQPLVNLALNGRLLSVRKYVPN